MYGKHEGRTGNACTNSEYLKTGVCSEFKQDTKKFGTKEAFLEKQRNKMLKAAVGHYPAMMMRRVPDTEKESDDDFDDEQPVEIGKHVQQRVAAGEQHRVRQHVRRVAQPAPLREVVHLVAAAVRAHAAARAEDNLERFRPGLSRSNQCWTRARPPLGADNPHSVLVLG